MTVRRDIGEANTVQQGLDTLAADAGAAAGDVPTLGEDGAVAFATPEAGGDGSQTVSMVGPVHLAWDDAGIGNSPGIEICEIAVGSVVLGMHFIPTADWDAGAGMTYIQATAVISLDGGGGRNIVNWDLLNAKATHSDVVVSAPLILSAGNTLLFFGGKALQAGETVNVNVISDAVPAAPTAGEADVYVLIGIPAA